MKNNNSEQERWFQKTFEIIDKLLKRYYEEGSIRFNIYSDPFWIGYVKALNDVKEELKNELDKNSKSNKRNRKRKN